MPKTAPKAAKPAPSKAEAKVETKSPTSAETKAPAKVPGKVDDTGGIADPLLGDKVKRNRINRDEQKRESHALHHSGLDSVAERDLQIPVRHDVQP